MLTLIKYIIDIVFRLINAYIGKLYRHLAIKYLLDYELEIL